MKVGEEHIVLGANAVVTHEIEHSEDEDGTYLLRTRDGRLALVQLNEGGQNGTTIALDELLRFLVKEGIIERHL